MTEEIKEIYRFVFRGYKIMNELIKVPRKDYYTHVIYLMIGSFKANMYALEPKESK